MLSGPAGRRSRLVGTVARRRHLAAAIERGEARSIGAASGQGSAFARFVAAIDEVDRLRRLGVRGAALTRAIERIGRRLQEPIPANSG